MGTNSNNAADTITESLNNLQDNITTYQKKLDEAKVDEDVDNLFSILNDSPKDTATTTSTIQETTALSEAPFTSSGPNDVFDILNDISVEPPHQKEDPSWSSMMDMLKPDNEDDKQDERTEE